MAAPSCGSVDAMPRQHSCEDLLLCVWRGFRKMTKVLTNVPLLHAIARRCKRMGHAEVLQGWTNGVANTKRGNSYPPRMAKLWAHTIHAL